MTILSIKGLPALSSSKPAFRLKGSKFKILFLRPNDTSCEIVIWQMAPLLTRLTPSCDKVACHNCVANRSAEGVLAVLHIAVNSVLQGSLIDRISNLPCGLVLKVTQRNFQSYWCTIGHPLWGLVASCYLLIAGCSVIQM